MDRRAETAGKESGERWIRRSETAGKVEKGREESGDRWEVERRQEGRRVET